MKKKITKLFANYTKAEQKLWHEIARQKNFTRECDCSDREVVDFMHYGDEKEIMTFCLNCGGYV